MWVKVSTYADWDKGASRTFKRLIDWAKKNEVLLVTTIPIVLS